MSYLSRRLFFVLFLQVLLFSEQSLATSVLKLSSAELASGSEVVVLGTVLSSETSKNEKGMVVTTASLQIEELLLGSSSFATLSVIRYGGDFEGKTYSLVGNAILTPGERVVVFLTKADESRYAVVGLAQGKYTVKGATESGDLILSRDLEGLKLIESTSSVVAPGEEERITLSELAKRISSVKE